jgi:multidrug transporter EmrE-like cation transporter
MSPLLVLAASILLNVSGQLAIKQSLVTFSSQAGAAAGFGLSNAVPILCSPLTLLGLLLYAISAIFWIAALTRVELSYAYPMLGAGYILVSVLAWQLWGEQMTPQRAVGTLVVALGVYLVGTSSH